MGESILFGDVFKYNEKDYIFLVRTDLVTYAAEILDTETSQKLIKLWESRLYSGKENILKISLYSFVKLDTSEFKDRCAHLHKTGRNNNEIFFEKLNIQIDKKDIKEIQKEILESKFVPVELKNLVKDITA